MTHSFRIAPTQPLITENQMQASIFAEADMRANQDSRWRYLLAIPNGQYRPGQRMEPGLRPGAPDIIWPIPSRGYVGLAMECKVGKNRAGKAQVEWLAFLKDQGWYTCIVRDDPTKASEILNWYVSEDDDE